MPKMDDEIKRRMEMDDEDMQSAYESLAQGVAKHTPLGETGAANQRIHLKNVMEDILAYYHIQNVQLPDDLKDTQEAMTIVLAETGMMRRSIELNEAWYQNATGALLGELSDGTPVALLPHGLYGYAYTDPKTGGRVRLNKKNRLFNPKERHGVLQAITGSKNPHTRPAFIHIRLVLFAGSVFPGGDDAAGNADRADRALCQQNPVLFHRLQQ